MTTADLLELRKRVDAAISTGEVFEEERFKRIASNIQLHQDINHAIDLMHDLLEIVTFIVDIAKMEGEESEEELKENEVVEQTKKRKK